MKRRDSSPVERELGALEGNRVVVAVARGSNRLRLLTRLGIVEVSTNLSPADARKVANWLQYAAYTAEDDAP